MIFVKLNVDPSASFSPKRYHEILARGNESTIQRIAEGFCDCLSLESKAINFGGRTMNLGASKSRIKTNPKPKECFFYDFHTAYQ